MDKLLKLTRSVQWMQVRFKYRGNKPRPDKLSRRVLMEVTKPFTRDDLYDDDIDMCSIVKYRREQRHLDKEKLDDEDLYEQFLIKELGKEISNCRLISVCQLESMGLVDTFNIKNPFLDAGLKPILFPAQACIKMLSSCKYKHLASLMDEHSMMVVAESEDLTKQLIKVLKGLPTVHLLGGVVGDRIMTKQGMIKFASLPDLQTSRSHCLATMNHGARSMASLLSHQQHTLVMSLQQLIERQKEKEA